MTNTIWATGCSWADKLQLRWRIGDKMTNWSWDDRLHLSYRVQLSRQSHWQVRLSWQLSLEFAAVTAELTDCSQTNKTTSSWSNTVELSDCSQAHKLQMRRQNIAQAEMTNHLSYQGDAELTSCSQADKLHVVACRLPCCYPSDAVNNAVVSPDLQKKLLNVLRSRLPIPPSGTSPASELNCIFLITNKIYIICE